MGLIYDSGSVSRISDLANEQADLFKVQNDSLRQKKIIRNVIIIGSGLFLLVLLKVVKK
jgi:hypothetical protein